MLATKLGSPDAPSGPAPATTLRTEDIRDGSANCLDRVGDWLSLASPQIRARSEVLMLRDTRPGAEGETGHAVIRQGETVFDPSTGQTYPSFSAFNAAGNYQIAGVVSGSAMHQILSTPPGSEARDAAIERARIPPSVAAMLVADPGDGAPRDVTAAYDQLVQGYMLEGDLAGAVDWALDNTAGNPELQGELIALLEGSSAGELTQQLGEDADDRKLFPVPGESMPTVTHDPVTGAVPDNALDAVINQIPGELAPALRAARDAGILSDEDMVQGLGSARTGDGWMQALTTAGINPISGNSVPQAIAEVQQAQQAYQAALDDRAALDQRLAADLGLFGPYLTPEQQQAYIAQFHQVHEDEYGEIDAVAGELDAALTENAAQLDLALQGPDGGQYADTISGAYGSLANSAFADHAITWALGASGPDSSFAPFAATHDLGAVMQSAVPNSLSAYLQQYPDARPEDAIRHLDGVTQAYLAQQGISSASDLAHGWNQGIQGLYRLARGDVDGGLALLKGVPASPGHFSAGFAAAGLVIGILATADAAKKGDTLGEAWGIAFSGQQAASLIDTALKAAGRSSSIAGRMVGGLGVVAGALDVVVQLREIQQGDGNLGTGISIAGDALGIIGGAMLVASPSGPGALVAGIGAAVYVVGELISAGIQADEAHRELLEEQSGLLDSVGADSGNIMSAAYNVLSPQAVMPYPAYPGIIGLLAEHDGAGTPIVFDRGHDQSLVFTGVTSDNRIGYRNPWTGETGSMSFDQFFGTVTGVHVTRSEQVEAEDPFRPQEAPNAAPWTPSPPVTSTPGAPATTEPTPTAAEIPTPAAPGPEATATPHP